MTSTKTDKGYGDLCLMEKPLPGLAEITLNRPEKRNAMSSALQAELRAALLDSWDCHVVTIIGSGPAFCAGVDLKEGQERRERGEGPTRSYANDPTSWGETNMYVTRHPAVCVALVNGFAIAGGMSLVHSCDLAIASEKAEFGMTEMGFGSFPALVAPLTSKRVLDKHMRWMVFTVQRQNAQRAYEMGIVNMVVPHDDLATEGRKLAERMLNLDPHVVDWAKKCLNHLPSVPWEMAGYFGGLTGQVARQGRTTGQDSLNNFLTGKPGLGQGQQQR